MKNSTIEELAQQAELARREKRFSDARHKAEEAVALCRHDGENQKLVRALMLLGQIERDEKQKEKALMHYEEAVSISRETDAPSRFAHTIRHLADLYCEEGRMDLSEESYQESLAIYRAQEKASPGDLANAIRGLAVVKDASGASNEAKPLWEEARGLYAMLGVEEGVAECNTHLRD